MDIPSSSGSNARKRKHSDDNDDTGPKIEPLEKLSDLRNEYDASDDDVEDEEVINKSNDEEYERILDYQEAATITQYGDIKITPFNLEEELEEGEFDKAGNFTVKKEDENDELNDTWAESVDWAAVERKERERKEAGLGEPKRMDAEDDRPKLVRDKLSCYKQMLRIMRPDETVQRAIRRLGNDVPKRPRNNRPKNKAPETQNVVDKARIDEVKKKLDEMIELAHQRLEDGEFDIYGKSYEALEEIINE